MKKTLIVVLAFVLCIAMCACGNDSTPPTITMTKTSFEVEYGSEFNIANYANSINISDDKDGKLDLSKLATDDKLDTTVTGSHKVTYYIRDKAGNIGTIDIEIIVKKGVKAQLCDGVWCWQTDDWDRKNGLWVSTRIFEFKPDNTFTVYAGIYCSNHSMDSRPMTESYSGKYRIDEERSRIHLTSTGQTVTYPFVISEFTHEVIFQDVLGESTFWKEKSLQDGLSWYDKVH